MLSVYVSGPYTAPTREGVIQNCRMAYEHSVRLWKAGFGVFCPHYNTLFMETRQVPYESFMEFDLMMVRRVDCVYMLPGWRDSKGAVREHDLALSLKKPIFYNLAQARHYLKHNRLYLED